MKFQSPAVCALLGDAVADGLCSRDALLSHVCPEGVAAGQQEWSRLNRWARQHLLSASVSLLSRSHQKHTQEQAWWVRLSRVTPTSIIRQSESPLSQFSNSASC